MSGNYHSTMLVPNKSAHRYREDSHVAGLGPFIASMNGWSPCSHTYGGGQLAGPSIDSARAMRDCISAELAPGNKTAKIHDRNPAKQRCSCDGLGERWRVFSRAQVISRTGHTRHIKGQQIQSGQA